MLSVTSRLRKERILDVPIAITIFSEQEIEYVGIERAGDFIAMMPHMMMDESQNSSTSFITICGFSKIINCESPVVVPVNGVLQIDFPQFNYSFAEGQELTVADRYDVDKHEQVNRTPLEFDTNAGQVHSAVFKKFQPKVSYSYTDLDNISLYATFSEGFRSSGFNQNGIGEQANTIGVTYLYKAEEIINFEVDIKTFYPKQTTRFNSSLFNPPIDNQHYFIFVGALGDQVLTNIDKMQLIRSEFDFKTSIIPNFDVYGGVDITDSEIKEFTLNSDSISRKTLYPFDYKLNLCTKHSIELNSGWQTMFTLDTEYRGKQFWDTSNKATRENGDLVNGRFGFNNDDGQWSVNLLVKNIFDKKYNTEWISGGFACFCMPITLVLKPAGLWSSNELLN